ncbi:MAG: glycosyltransferase [Gemmatimonadota bacterium]|nr:glycosyltransferase [Gemmatimonadota bacterium]
MVSHRFPPDAVAGVERYTESLAARLVALGDSVTALSRRPAPGPVRPVRERHDGGVDVIRLVGGGVDRDQWLNLAGELDAWFAATLDEVRPDVVHVNHLVDLSPGFLTLAREAGAAVVLTAHDFWLPCPRITLQRPDGSLCGGPEGGRACATHCLANGGEAADEAVNRLRLRALYFRRLLDIPDRLLCPSRYVAEWFEGWGIESGRMQPVANGIRIPERKPPRPRSTVGDGRLTIAILGAVVRHKGHATVVEALARAGVEADLYVHGPLGDPELVAEIRSAARAIPGVSLHVCGPYEPRDLSLLLEGVDLLVAPSVWPETFCLVIREALVRGIPAITTRLGALPDAIEHGVNGFLYDHDDPDELAGLFERLAGEPHLLDVLGDGAAATAVPGLDEHADRVRRIYIEALETRTSNAARARTAAIELAAIEALLGEDASRGAEAHTLEGVA